jgi:hypothetical protein
MQKAVFAYDELDILTFVQTTGSAVVEAFDAEVDDIASTTGVTTNVLDLGAASPNYQGQSVYIVPRPDSKGTTIAGTGDPKIIATLLSGATASAVNVTHVVSHQSAQTEVLEIPLPATVGRYIDVNILSNGGGASNAINKGAVQVFIGPSGWKG